MLVYATLQLSSHCLSQWLLTSAVLRSRVPITPPRQVNAKSEGQHVAGGDLNISQAKEPDNFGDEVSEYWTFQQEEGVSEVPVRCVMVMIKFGLY